MMSQELYEVSDMRGIPHETRISPVAVLQNIPGKIHIWEVTGKSRSLPLDENYEWKDGELTIYTDQGMVHFSPLTEDSDALAFVHSPLDGLLQDCLQ